MNWAKQQITYEHIKTAALSKLMLTEQVISQPAMPTIEIAGPKENVLSLPEKGQFMLISLWSSTCKECIVNLTTLKKLQHILHGYKEDWKIIGVSIDSPDNLEEVTKIIKKYKLSDIAEYYDAYGTLLKYIEPKTIPVTIIINDDGHIMYKIHGNAPWLDPDVISFLRIMPDKK
jgi:peroxiredoxin